MKVLCLDTSSKFLSLAVAKRGKILAQTHRALDRKHSLQLVPLIDKILKKAKLRLQNIDGFCISKGPGSFTGLRIGITTIKGLAFALEKPIVAVGSLDVLAENVKIIKTKNIPKDICALVDARQNKVYACLYKRENGKIKRASRYFLLTISELMTKLKDEVLFLGDGIGVYRDEIKKNKKLKAVFADAKFWYPKAQGVVSLAVERFSQNKIEDVNNLVPLYLYAKTCQIKKVKK